MVKIQCASFVRGELTVLKYEIYVDGLMDFTILCQDSSYDHIIHLQWIGVVHNEDLGGEPISKTLVLQFLWSNRGSLFIQALKCIQIKYCHSPEM
mmetsp:Transcript_4955/g.6531  ORF Transcript_4955/g.6531 Transcript_4955/m.6531 type:complete len:95 (+) Transcript_4955:383-667(+)